MQRGARTQFAKSLVGFGVVTAFAACEISPAEPSENIEILGLQRQPSAPIPPASRLKDMEPLPLAIQIPRTGLRVLARNAEIALLVFPCRDRRRVFYASELYLEGNPIRQFDEGNLIGNPRALLEREANAPGKGNVAAIIAVVPRRYTDGLGLGPICTEFANRRTLARNEQSAAVQIPPPGPADLRPLGISAELIERAAGVESARFAEELVRSEAARLGLDAAIYESSEAPIGVRESSPNQFRRVIVYYDVGEPAERRGHVCRVEAPNGGLRYRLEVLAYRQCAMRLGIRPASEPPRGVLMGPVSHYVGEPRRWITCPAHGGCPELEAAIGNRTNEIDR